MATANTKSYAQQYLDANPDVKAEYEAFHERDPKKWTPESYVAYHYTSYGAGEGRSGGDFQKTTDYLADQILGQGVSSKWSGEGMGSSKANAKDMGKILASIGITDISQFGKIPKYEEAMVQTGPDGKPVYGTMQAEWQGSGENGGYVEAFTPLPDQSKVTLKDGKPMVVVGETYGNKLTGQEVPNTYSERQQGTAWGGTFAGKGNTGYRVQFDAKGNPVFYTTGASSNDLANMLDDPVLGKLAQAGAAYFGGPLGSAALNLAMGKDPEDVLKAAALTYFGGEVANTVGGGLVDTLGQTGANIVGRAAGSIVTGADPVQALISGGLSEAVPAVTSNIPGFDTFSPELQRSINKTVASTLASGGDLPPNALINLAYSSVKEYLPTGGPQSSDFTQGYFEPGGEGYITPPTYAPSTKGYFDEITGHFIPDENGGLTFGQLTNETSGTNLGSMDDYKYNPETGNWTLPDGTEIDTSYMQNPRTSLTGADLLNRSGAGVATQPGTKPPATAAKPAGGSVDLNQLMSLLGGQQAAPTVVSSGQDNSADVQLMEDIFGTTLSAPPAGDTVAQSRELARLLRS